MTALLGGGIAAAVKVIEDKFGTTKSPTSPTRPAEMDRTLEEQEKNNPYAICTASVGRDDKKKYEKCVRDVKRQNLVSKVNVSQTDGLAYSDRSYFGWSRNKRRLGYCLGYLYWRSNGH